MNSDSAPAGGTGPDRQAERSRRPSRRTVLLAAAIAGGGGAAAAIIEAARPSDSGGAAGGRLASSAPGGAGRSRGTPGTRRPHGAGPSPADWSALAGELSPALLIRPGEQGYGRARLLFDPRFDQIRPAGIAYCRTAADVSACLSFARRFAVPVAARSGGHSYAGWSSGTGLIVDVTQMASFLAVGDTVRVGTGIRLIDFYAQLAARGLAVPGGSCATVGIAGLTLGGGVGVLGRALGLTCDNLEAVQIVTADGRLRDCNARDNADLFWASRGGGGGNFGVATSMTFGAHRLSSLTLFFLSWPWSQAEQVLSGWQSWAPYQGDELWSNLHLSAAPAAPVPLSVQVGGTFLGSPADASAALEKLTAAVGPAPSGGPFEASFLAAMLAEAGCADLTVPECHLPWQAPRGQLARQPEFAKSDFFTRPLPPAGIRTLLAGAEQFLRIGAAAEATGAIALDACGGAINRVHPADTAFVHRDALYLAQYTTTWAPGPQRGGAAGRVVNGGAARQRRWQRALHASMRPYASGQAYQNYIDPDLADWRQAYYGANYQRLARVKAAYDPDRLFRFPQGISPAS
ncbi:MAG TPA: FAD-binding oxidoreductase [Streptosporangiaceae bacterium]|nr:FAD-binding oxidoreductase [Streptosporangiaceae bacterium]